MSLFGKLNNESGKEIPRPSSRFSQFFYVIRNDLFLVTMISFINVLFVLPLLAFVLLCVYSLIHIKQVGDASEIFSFGLTNSFLLIPFFMFASIGVCGSYSLFKKILFGEVYHFSDFFKGIKESWWKFLLIGFVKGLSISVLVFCWLFYGYFTSQNIILVRVLATILYVLLGICLMYVSSQTVTYNLRFKQKIKNAIIFEIYGFFINILIFILRAIPLFLLLIAQTKLLLLIAFILIFFGGAIYSLISIERAFCLFDKLVHKDELKDYYRKGLRQN